MGNAFLSTFTIFHLIVRRMLCVLIIYTHICLRMCLCIYNMCSYKCVRVTLALYLTRFSLLPFTRSACAYECLYRITNPNGESLKLRKNESHSEGSASMDIAIERIY